MNMIKNSLLVWCLLPCLACALPRASGVKITETRTVEPFTEIAVSHDVTLEVKRGPVSVSIEGDDNIVPLYSTEVVGGRLKIRRQSASWRHGGGHVLVRVSVPSLTRVELSGGVTAHLDGSVAAPQFGLEASGGVELTADGLAVESLEVDASGGTELELVGRAQKAKFDLSGGVEVKARGLEANAVVVDGSGGCELNITAKESIIGEASGGTEFTVYGNPAKSRVQTSGGASVEYKD